MDLYFFLDSKIFAPAITVTSYPPSGAIDFDGKKDFFVCVAYPDNMNWKIKTYKKINYLERVNIGWSELGLDRELIKHTLVFLSPIYLEGNFDCLPEFNDFETVPNWRANLKIIGNETSVSYQGEYPYQMTKVKGGHVVSMVPFIQRSSTIKNYLFYVSFSNTTESRQGTVEFRNLKTMKKISKFDIFSNSVNFIDLNNVIFDDGQIMMVGSSLIGIPVFFSIDEDGRKMSLEHTMTPSEYSIFGEAATRRSIMQKMKAYWCKA